jgi:hypothetical protein
MYAIPLIQPQRVFFRFMDVLLDKRGDDFGEKAVILVLVVLAGVAAFAAFGQSVVEKVNLAATGI